MSSKFLRNAIIISIVVIFVLFSAIYMFVPKLSIEKSKIIINVNEEYNDVNFSAYKIGKDLTDKVKVDGIVDNTHVGTYKVTYELKDSIFDIKKVVEVEVVDNVAPDLNIYNDDKEEVKVCSLDDLDEKNYTAVDNYDGDLTDKVEKRIVDDNKVEYFVKDSSGNETKKEVDITVGDDEAPVIKLKGKDKVYVTVNNKYSDEGATALDNCDKDLTDKIETESNVDTSKVGNYEVTYKVTDNGGNTAELKREVYVQEEKADKNDANTHGIIYLTFDDGPSSYTNVILDTLKKYDVKATFFVTLSGSDDILKREYNEGHTVGLHTATHQYKIYSSVDTYFDDLNKVANRVKNATGYDSKYIRFPGGSSNTVSKNYKRGIMTTLAKEVQDRGYKYYDWNADVNDAGNCAYVSDKQSCVLRNFKNGISPNRSNVVLMHDIKSYTAYALEDMIKYGKSKGFTFKAIDDDTPTCHHGINN